MLRNAMEVLSLFSPRQTELGVVEASTMLGSPKSNVSRWLAAMEQAGFLERSPSSGRYRISMRLAAIGEMASHALPIQRMALPVLQRLVADTRETANLTVLSAGEVINIEAVESPRPVMTLGWIGRRLPVHATAAGRVLLAWRPPDEIHALARPPLERFTPRTLTDMRELSKELEQIRKRGFAIVNGEIEEDVAAIAAPVWNHSVSVTAAVTLSGPASRISNDATPMLAERVVEAAHELSRQLGSRAGVEIG